MSAQRFTIPARFAYTRLDLESVEVVLASEYDARTLQLDTVTQELEHTKSVMASDYEMDMNDQIRNRKAVEQHLAAAQALYDAEARRFHEMDKQSKRDHAQQVADLTAKLAEVTQELDAYRRGGLTEEVLRRQDGFLKVGRGCVVVLESDWQQLAAAQARVRELEEKL